MNKKTKLRYRAVLSLILSAVLFCMPAMAFSMNGNNAIDVRAEDSRETYTEEETEGCTEESTTEQETEESTTEQTESGTEDGTVSGNDIEPVCTCEDTVRCAWKITSSVPRKSRMCRSVSTRRMGGSMIPCPSLSQWLTWRIREILRLRKFRQRSGRMGAGRT